MDMSSWRVGTETKPASACQKRGGNGVGHYLKSVRVLCDDISA